MRKEYDFSAALGVDSRRAAQGSAALRIGIDATKPVGQPFAEKLLMTPEKAAWARDLVDRLGA